MKKRRRLLANILRAGAVACGVLAIMAAGDTSARAELITNISTGVLPDGTPLGNLVIDTKYTVALTGGSLGPGGPLSDNLTKVLDGPGFPFPPWVANSNDSKWITPNDPRFTQENAPPPAGSDAEFTYTVSFSLTAGQAAGAFLSGGPSEDFGIWTTDNEGLHVRFNGVDIATTLDPNDDQPFDSF
jgi:hypothetical protein